MTELYESFDIRSNVGFVGDLVHVVREIEQKGGPMPHTLPVFARTPDGKLQRITAAVFDPATSALVFEIGSL
jgi:hypothetical protein